MPTAPDYDKARDEAGFTWSVAANYLTYLTLSGISFRDFYLEPDACVEVYRKGRPAARELFGDDVTYAGPATPSVSYGHTNCLGCELVFPEGGEVGYVSSFADSLDRAIAAAEQPVDFAAAAMAPQYLALHEQMRAAFPGEAIKYAYGEEATITTAYIMRGEELFFDVMDEPEKSTRFLSLITESVSNT